MTLLFTGSVLPPLRVPAIAAFLVASVVFLVAREMLTGSLLSRPSFWLTLGLIFVVLLPSLLTPVQSEYGAEKVSAIATSCLVTALGVQVLQGREDVLAFAGSLTGLGVFLGIATLLSTEMMDERTAVFGSNSIWSARVVAAALVACVWLSFTTRLRPAIAVPSVLILLAGLLRLGSRGPLLAAVLGVICVILVTGRPGRRVAVALCALAVSLAFLALPVDWSQVRVFSFLSGASLGTESRLPFLSATWELIQEFPNGIGYGNWGWRSGFESYVYPHNLYLEALVEGGWIVGGIVIMLTLGTIVFLGFSARSSDLAQLALGLSVTMAVAVAFSGDLNARVFFGALALGWRVLELTAKRNDPDARNGQGGAVLGWPRPTTISSEDWLSAPKGHDRVPKGWRASSEPWPTDVVRN